MKPADFDSMTAIIRANLDQDREEARQWIKDCFPDGTAELWLYLNQPFSDPRLELMSQFAILAFEETYLHVHTDGENPS